MTQVKKSENGQTACYQESNKSMHADNLRGVEIAMSLRSILPQLRLRINYG